MLMEQIKQLHRLLLSGSADSWRVAMISGSEKVVDAGRLPASLPQTDGAVPGEQPQPSKCEFEERIRVSVNTSFAGGAVLLPELPISERARVLLAAELMKSRFLHREIREIGGAYGAGCSYSHTDHLLTFYSFRDPTPERSVEAFRRAMQWCRDGDIDQEALNEAKLAVIGAMDAPQDIGWEGLAGLFKHDISDDYRVALRRAVLDCRDVRGVGEVLLGGELSHCIVGPE